jgi:hypothetical protein
LSKRKSSQTAKIKSGRPPKFREPRRPVTVTLPESTLGRLVSIDPDRARAIVKATDVAMPLNGERQKQIELVEAAPGKAIIIVGPSQLLQKVEWLRLVEVAPMRFLLSMPIGTSVEALELAVVELLENAKPYGDWEHSLLSQLRDLLRRQRQRDGFSKAEMLFIDTSVMGGLVNLVWPLMII